MSSPTNSSDPLLHKDNFSSKIYWLNIPPEYELDLANLRDRLSGKTFLDDIGDEIDLDNIHVPDVFQRDGEVSKSFSIDSIQIENDENGKILIASATLDESQKIEFRGQGVLLMNTEQANFMIFKHDGIYYLVVIGSRSLSESIVESLKTDVDEIGSAINETELDPDALDQIQDRIDAKIQNPYSTDYPEKELTGVQVYGDDVEDTQEYQQQVDRGELSKYMLKTEELVSDSSQTIGISRDGLVRLYTKVTLSTYLGLLYTYILPELDLENKSSPNLYAYESEETPVLKQIERPSNEVSTE